MSIHFLGMDLDLDEVTKESFSSNVPSVVRLWLGSTVKSETWPMSCQEKWQVEGNQDVAWWVKLEDKDWNDPFPNFGVLAPMFSILARQHHHKKHPGFSQTCKPFQWSVRWSKHVQAEHVHFHLDSPWILHGSRPQVAKKTHPLSPVPQQFQAWHCWLMLSPHASTCQPNGYRGAIGRWKSMSSPNPRIETNKTGSKLNLSSSQFQSSHKPRRRSRIDIHRYPSISHLS